MAKTTTTLYNNGGKQIYTLAVGPTTGNIVLDSGSYTFSGANTFSGNNTFSGTDTFSNVLTCNGGVKVSSTASTLSVCSDDISFTATISNAFSGSMNTVYSKIGHIATILFDGASFTTTANGAITIGGFPTILTANNGHTIYGIMAVSIGGTYQAVAYINAGTSITIYASTNASSTFASGTAINIPTFSVTYITS